MKLNLENMQSLRGECGIYYLYNDSELVYIGESSNVYVRLLEHEGEKEKEFNSYKVALFKSDHRNILLRELIEVALINEHKPKYNKLIVENLNIFFTALPNSMDTRFAFSTYTAGLWYFIVRANLFFKEEKNIIFNFNTCLIENSCKEEQEEKKKKEQEKINEQNLSKGK